MLGERELKKRQLVIRKDNIVKKTTVEQKRQHLKKRQLGIRKDNGGAKTTTNDQKGQRSEVTVAPKKKIRHHFEHKGLVLDFFFWLYSRIIFFKTFGCQ